MNNTISSFYCHLAHRLLITVFISICFNVKAKADMDEQRVMEMLQDPVTVQEMRTFSKLFTDSLTTYGDINLVEQQVDELVNSYINGEENKSQYRSKLQKFSKQIDLIYEDYVKNFPIFPKKSESKFSELRGYHIEVLNFMNELNLIYDKVYLIEKDLIKAAIDEDYVLYDNYLSELYIEGANLTKKTIKVQKSALNLSPSYSIANKVTTIELILTEILSEFNKLTGLILKTNSVNIEESIEIVRDNVNLFNSNIDNASRDFYAFVQSFFTIVDDPVFNKFFNSDFKNEIELLKSLSIEYAEGNISLGNSYVELINLYYKYRFNLDDLPIEDINRINVNISIAQESLNETLPLLRYQFELIQNTVISVMNENNN